MPNQPPPRRRFQFGLGELLFIVTVLCIAAGAARAIWPAAPAVAILAVMWILIGGSCIWIIDIRQAHIAAMERAKTRPRPPLFSFSRRRALIGTGILCSAIAAFLLLRGSHSNFAAYLAPDICILLGGFGIGLMVGRPFVAAFAVLMILNLIRMAIPTA